MGVTNTMEFTGSRGEQRVRLLRFDVVDLYDEFNYSIPLDIDTHVTAVIAPNGSGKTLCLRLISGLFSKNWMLFERIVFGQAKYVFSDGTVIEVSKPQTELNLDEDGAVPSTIVVDVTDSHGVRHASWSPHRRRHPSRMVEQYLPFLTRTGENTWIDRRTSEILTWHELIDQYGNDIPSTVLRKVALQPSDFLDTFLSRINCTLIETQRLIILSEQDEVRGTITSRDNKRTQYAISRKASALRDIISREMNQYAALSQSLDRTFPGRAISTSLDMPQSDIEDQLFVLDKKRKKLMDVGILDSEQDVPMALPSKELEPALASVLGIYIEDNRKKLDSLDPLYDRIALFKQLIDARFGRKHVQVSKQKGLSVQYGGRDVPLETLSSGEQHQLVLFFELLFETKKNSLILIDEPEISLHVSWQKKFIADLMSIIDLNKFDVVLATHSPQLIGKWADLVVELGDVFGGDETPDWTGAKE